MARSRVASLVGASLDDGDRVYFCSCATESISWIVRGVVERCGDITGSGACHIVAGATEHVAVLECLKWAETRGARVTLIDAGADGRVDADAVAAAASEPGTALVSLMLANNETGVINDVARAARLVRANAVAGGRSAPFFHCDASQAAGKIDVDFARLGADALTLAGHKLYAPKGIGATVLRAGVVAPPALLRGGSQEDGSRAGTENVAFAAAMGAAAEAARAWLQSGGADRQARLRARLALALSRNFANAGISAVAHGPLAGPFQSRSCEEDFLAAGAHTLPNTLSVGIRGCRASALVRHLRDTVAVSAGSACHAGHQEHASHVLASMGRGGGVERLGGLAAFGDFARGTLRLSLSRHTTELDIDQAVILIVDAVEKHVEPKSDSQTHA